MMRAQPLRPQRLERPILLEALAACAARGSIEINVLQPQLAQRVATGPHDRGAAGADCAGKNFVVIQMSSRCTSGRSFKKIASASPRPARCRNLQRVDVPVAAAQACSTAALHAPSGACHTPRPKLGICRPSFRAMRCWQAALTAAIFAASRFSCQRRTGCKKVRSAVRRQEMSQRLCALFKWQAASTQIIAARKTRTKQTAVSVRAFGKPSSSAVTTARIGHR